MDKKKTEIDLEEIKIISRPQYFGLIIGFVFAIGVNFSTFINMKDQITNLKEVTQELDEQILAGISQQNDKHVEVIKTTADIQGQLKVIREQISNNNSK